jgi:hypothetical protein
MLQDLVIVFQPAAARGLATRLGASADGEVKRAAMSASWADGSRNARAAASSSSTTATTARRPAQLLLLAALVTGRLSKSLDFLNLLAGAAGASLLFNLRQYLVKTVGSMALAPLLL